MSIGQRLQEMLVETGKLQTEVADSAGVGRGAISAIVRGRTKNPQPEHLFLIADALGVEPRWLATGKGTKYRDRNPLSKEQQHVLSLYQKLPENTQQAILQILDSAAEYKVDRQDRDAS